MKTKFDWGMGESNLPDVSQEALKNYFVYGFEPGSFLYALLCNKPWVEVISRADHWNKTRLYDYLKWLNDLAPDGSWGSEELVKDWLNHGHYFQEYQKVLLLETIKDDYS